MTKEKIIIVDDEKGMLNFLSKLLTSQGYTVKTCTTGKSFLQDLDNEKQNFSLAIIDYSLPDTNGTLLLQKISALQADIKSIIITAYGDVHLAVETMKLGATDFLAKPFTGSEIIQAVERCLEPARLREENKKLRWQLAARKEKSCLVYTSRAFAEVINMAATVASSSATVLLTGESGTGKEIVANYIHQHSDSRSQNPFITINCGTLTDNLLESQLFGSLRGSYTGAHSDSPGYFQAADGGTILLDEIADTSPSLQLKLLRVLETKEITPVGGTKPIKIDVRIIAATNKNLEQEVEAGRFRRDLFYRLQVFTIDIPPLRQRIDDIEPLVEYFLTYYTAREGLHKITVSTQVINIMQSYPWPGNVRELRNLVHRAVILAPNGHFGTDLLPFNTLDHGLSEAETARKSEGKNVFFRSLAEVELNYINKVWHHVNKDRKKASKILGISEKTLGRKLKKITDHA